MTPNKLKSRGINLDRLPKQPPSWNYNEMMLALESSSDPAVALLASACLDLALEEAICERFLTSQSEHNEHLFGGSAPLSSMLAKMHLCYALGIFGKITRSDIASICKIRNVFAHARSPLAFSAEAIANKCSSLNAIRDYQAAGKYEFIGLLPDYSDPRSVFVTSCIGIAMTIASYRKTKVDGKIYFSSNMGPPQIP